MVFFLIFLYRSIPFLFSLLVTASPVLVCAAVLLGTLLSFGQPNIPEIEKEEKRTDEIVSLKTEVSRDAIVVEKDDSLAVERYIGKGRDVAEESVEETRSTASKFGDVDKDDHSLADGALLIGENSREIQFEKRVIEEAERELHDSGFEKKSKMKEELPCDEEVVENHYSPSEKVENKNVEVDLDTPAAESVDSLMEDNLVCSPISPWKKVDVEDEEADGEEASDSGSDRAESSSPDASIADIIPMLDELHPLLDEDAPQLAHMSHDGSDAASERSPKSSDGINVSDEDIENQEEDDDAEEEETQGGKEDGTKSAITWTEDDQKNLMDLGTSELERNQRLESLIARRRARKDLRMMAEKNLIDLESSDIQFNIAPISTTRRNPFDLPYDSNYNMGLPPIPGSAPSILLPRRNPFDLPYDSSEEKPDLMGDSFQQEFISFHPKETLFRRHESFNVGPSFFGPPKQEKQDIKLRPYFIPERMASEGTSYSSFQRQSSELIRKLLEDDFSQEELISNTELAPEHVGHGSESSEDIDSVLDQAEERGVGLNEVEIKLGDVEIHQEMEMSSSETGGVGTPAEHHTGEVHLNAGAVEHSSESGTSSLSEVNVKIFNAKEDERISNLEAREGNLTEESGISMQPMVEELDFKISSGLVDDSPYKEPVYDSSPPAVKKNLSSSSISSDLQVETSEMGLPLVLVKRTVSEVSNQSIENDMSGNEKMLAGPLQVLAVAENELGQEEVRERSVHDVLNFGFTHVDQNVDSANASLVPEFVVEHASINSEPSSDTQSVEDHPMCEDESHQREHEQVPPLSSDADIHVAVLKDVGENMDSAAFSSQDKSFGDLNLAAPEEEQPSLVVEQVSGTYQYTSSDTESIEEHSISKEVALQFEEKKVHLSSSDASFHVSIHEEADENLVSIHYQSVTEEKSMSELEKQLIELSSENPEELQEPSVIHAESIEEVIGTSNLHVSEVQEPNNNVSSNIYSPLTLDHTRFPTEVSETKSPTSLTDLTDNIVDGIEYEEQIQVLEHFDHPEEATGSHVDEQNIIEEADEMKEIDEGLLLELDTVAPIEVNEIKAVIDPENQKASRAEQEIDRYPEVEDASELQTSGTCYIEHVDLSVREFVHGEVDNPMGLKLVNNESPDFRINQNSIAEEINSEMTVVEARSVEDIDSIFKKTGPISMKSEVELGEFEMPHQGQIRDEINYGMPVLEAQSVEDISLAFKQISEEEIKKPVVIESLHAELIPEETKVRGFRIWDVAQRFNSDRDQFGVTSP
ncbi:hypothetical protein F0562_016208 [Nyssa sinensis]|uniref:Uncharacterized protein n=1 Tax=Nyssa sinensis TaxID=561372 RepID=A0A5J4ZMY5_9ASTE|nr:hypothetical protein F0562_016208 [Nyssa sinensis]